MEQLISGTLSVLPIFQGPMIRCQWPEDYISKDMFDVLSR